MPLKPQQHSPSHSASATVTHHGFSEEQIRGIFEQAGVGKDFDLEEVGTVSFHISDQKRRVFIARGTKA
jgi:hypothetical protein